MHLLKVTVNTDRGIQYKDVECRLLLSMMMLLQALQGKKWSLFSNDWVPDRYSSWYLKKKKKPATTLCSKWYYFYVTDKKSLTKSGYQSLSWDKRLC